MIITRDATGLTVKESVDAIGHVRVAQATFNVTEIVFWVGCQRRAMRFTAKLPCQLTAGELYGLLDKLRKLSADRSGAHLPIY